MVPLLTLFVTSQKAYNALKASGIIAMPNDTTLRKYKNYGASAHGMEMIHFERAANALHLQAVNHPGTGLLL